jgi:hypothetical protein
MLELLAQTQGAARVVWTGADDGVLCEAARGADPDDKSTARKEDDESTAEVDDIETAAAQSIARGYRPRPRSAKSERCSNPNPTFAEADLAPRRVPKARLIPCICRRSHG